MPYMLTQVKSPPIPSVSEVTVLLDAPEFSQPTTWEKSGFKLGELTTGTLSDPAIPRMQKNSCTGKDRQTVFMASLLSEPNTGNSQSAHRREKG